MYIPDNPDPYEMLVQGIVLQAKEDLFYTSPDYPERQRRIRNDARKFFMSEWFKFLTGLEGKSIMEKILLIGPDEQSSN